MPDSTTAAETRDTKLEIIMGRPALNKLAAATVLVLGCGGVGSNCIEALARGGVGHFIILDKDIVAPSNINRQAIAFHSTIGQRKVDVMEAMIHDINPAATVIKRTEYILSENTDDFFNSVLEQAGGKIDYVVDAIDTISAKLSIALYAQEHDLRLVSSMGGGNKLHPECLHFSDIFKTVRDPMSRIMQKARNQITLGAIKLRGISAHTSTRHRRHPRALRAWHRELHAPHHGTDDCR